MTKTGAYLRSAEAARRFGVSGKTLRLYEAHGLLRAERTLAGWRVYGPEQIARLHQIIGTPPVKAALSSGDQAVMLRS